MKNATRKFSFGRLLAASALVSGAMFAGQVAMACTLDNWSSNFGSDLAAGDPAADGIARYQGLCGLKVSGQGYVQDDSPAGIDRIVARFYVLNDNAELATIYSGYGATDGSDEVFKVELDDSGQVTLTDTTTGEFVQQSGSTKWLSVEIDWVRDASGSISLSVNGQGEVEQSVDNSVATQLASVQLGNLNDAAGTLGFDSYESRRSTAVGRLIVGDANADGTITGGDLAVIAGEILGDALANGQPDCNEDGTVTGGDLACAASIILGL